MGRRVFGRGRCLRLPSRLGPPFRQLRRALQRPATSHLAASCKCRLQRDAHTPPGCAPPRSATLQPRAPMHPPVAAAAPLGRLHAGPPEGSLPPAACCVPASPAGPPARVCAACTRFPRPAGARDHKGAGSQSSDQGGDQEVRSLPRPCQRSTTAWCIESRRVEAGLNQGLRGC